jgi:hypothetical protein
MRPLRNAALGISYENASKDGLISAIMAILAVSPGSYQGPGFSRAGKMS